MGGLREHCYSSRNSQSGFLYAAVIALALPGFAQEPPAPAFDKWRPTAGVYAEPGKNFQSSCDESGGLTIDLGEKSVSG